jgi:hypothetical protein
VDQPSGTLVRQIRQATSAIELRQSRYSYTVVTLYGAFERFVDLLISRYVEMLEAAITRYQDLPETIQASHERRTLEALNDATWLARTQTSSSSLIQNLYLCNTDPDGFKLNGSVYARHPFNYRRESLGRAFSPLGVTKVMAQLVSSRVFQTFLPGPRLEGLTDGECRAIDDLAERRNDVAHGEPTDLLSLEYLNEYLDFFWMIGMGLFDVLRRHLMEHLLLARGLPVMEVDEVHYKTVVCPDLSLLPDGTVLKVGMPIFTSRRLRPAVPPQFGSIREIRVDNVMVDQVTAREGVVACLNLTFPPSRNTGLLLCDLGTEFHWILEDVADWQLA